MTRKLLCLMPLMLAYPALAQLTAVPIAPRGGGRLTVPVITMQWTVQAYDASGASVAPMFETSDAATALSKAADYCGQIGGNDEQVNRVLQTNFRGLMDERSSDYFPCDVTTNDAGGRVARVLVIVQKAK